MYRPLLLGILCRVLLFGNDSCPAPPDAITKLAAYLSFGTRDGRWTPGMKSFAFAQVQDDALFLQHELPKYFDPSRRPVYAFRKGSRIFTATCPNNSQWPKCVEEYYRKFLHAPPNPAERPVPTSCELSVAVPKWRASPDSPLKTRLASEIIQELFGYGYENPKQVYVRDFNVADPELEFYIVDRNGKDEFQGCTFDADLRPHCAWHLFGTVSITKLKEGIMEHPYRLLAPQTPRKE